MTEATTPVTPVKKNGVCSKSIEGTTVTFEFTDGTVRSRDVTKYPEEVIHALACHGLSQKGGDSYAAAGGDVHFAVTQIDKVLTNLDAGILIGTRTGTGGGAAKPESELVEAICELQSLDKTTVQNLLTAASDDEKKAIRANKHVKAKVLEIKARKAAAAAASDTESLADLFKAA